MQRRSLLPSAFGGFTTPSPRQGSDPFLALHREMNRLFDEAFRGFGLPEGGAGSEAIASGVAVPRIDVSETDQGLKVFVELPGVDHGRQGPGGQRRSRLLNHPPNHPPDHPPADGRRG